MHRLVPSPLYSGERVKGRRLLPLPDPLLNPRRGRKLEVRRGCPSPRSSPLYPGERERIILLLFDCNTRERVALLHRVDDFLAAAHLAEDRVLAVEPVGGDVG